MFKKIIIAILIPLMLTGTWMGTAFAAEPSMAKDDPRGHVVYGTVTAVKEDGFEIETHQGEEVFYRVEEHTRFRRGSFDDLAVGSKVGVASRGGGNPVADLVIILPPDFEPGGRFEVRAHGVVSDINLNAGKFRIQTAEGEELTFFVDEDTRYGGQLDALSDLEIGWRAAAAGEKQGEGKVIAAVVIAGEQPERMRVRGRVTAVDALAGKFRLASSNGQEHTFFVDENTRFAGQAEELSDLQVGWAAGVLAKEWDGRLLALGVIAGDRPEAERIRGKVSGVDSQAGKFRLETPAGGTVTIFVDENTRYGGQLESLSDLQVGWAAGTGVVEGPEGNKLALWVVAGDAEPLLKARGEITAVDARAGKFRLQKANGDVLTLTVGEKTRFKGQAASLYDLQVGWKAGVVAREGEEGIVHALLVVAGEPRSSDRPRPETAPEGEFGRQGGPEDMPFLFPPEG